MTLLSNKLTDTVFRRQKPTFAIAFEIATSSADMMAATDRVPPMAARSFVIAASVTSSFVWEDNIKDTSVANRRF